MPETFYSIKQLICDSVVSERTAHRKFKRASDAKKGHISMLGIKIEFTRLSDEDNAQYLIRESSYTDFRNVVEKK